MTSRFELYRGVDECVVADGVVFDCGYAIVCWRETTRIETPTVGWYPDVKAVVRIHGNNGKTRLVWLDLDPREVSHVLDPRCEYVEEHPYEGCEIPEPDREAVWLAEDILAKVLE